jgi:hypothetical protein
MSRAITALLGLLTCLMLPTVAGAAVASPDSSSPASVSALSPAEVEGLLAGVPLQSLSAAQLAETLSRLRGLSAIPQAAREEALVKAIEALAAGQGTLGQLTGSTELVSELESRLKGLLAPTELLSLLKGQTLSSALTEAFGSVSARQLLGAVLSSAGQPEQVIEDVLAAPSSPKLEPLLGGALSGQPFTAGTVGELANEAGTSAAGLAEDFGTTSSQLPASAMALTAPLTNGKTLGVLDALDGVDLGTLGSSREGGKGGAGGSSAGGTGGEGGSSPGGTAGKGANGSSVPSTPAGITILLGQAAAPSPFSLGSMAKAALAKVKIVGHRVRRGSVTLVVQVPAAGSLKISGKGTAPLSRQTDGAERMTLRMTLTKAATASLRKSRHSLRIKLTATFTAMGGPHSSVSTTVAFT